MTRNKNDDLLSAARFAAHVGTSGHVRRGDRVLVAASGGLDSTVLLHLFRFGLPDLELDVQAAHFNHRTRPSSAGDADWLSGLCRAWGVPLTQETATEVPRNEAEARAFRYAFFEQARTKLDAAWVLTAHHADDQAETVLFRAVRGSGLRGLAGIGEVRDGWLLRPLLPFSRSTLETYARSQRLGWREDPTNTDPRFRRNVLRHFILPTLERDVAPGASKSLVRLAHRAREVEEVLQGLATAALDAATIHSETGQLVLNHQRVREIPGVARAEVLRAAAARLGAALTHSGTRIAVEVSSADFGQGGRDLGGGFHLSVQYDELVLERGERVAVSRPVHMVSAEAGAGGAMVGGRALNVHWSRSTGGHEDPDESPNANFAPADLNFPLTIRPWRPGDRIHLRHGSKKLKQLFQEVRLPRWRRGRQPLLVDAQDRVLWAPELARSVTARCHDNAPSFRVAIVDADD